MNRKYAELITILFLIITTFTGSGRRFVSSKQNEISDKIIRFHVIANSDNIKDQAVKMKIKSSILSYIQPKLSDTKDIEECRKILSDEDENIKNIAKNLLKENDMNYKVDTSLTHENFPPKVYGELVFPQGNYEAYRVIIGSGEGRNWWCVMFPPLCFVDISRGALSNSETESKIKEVLTDDEYEELINYSENSDNKIVYKLKIFECIKKIYEKVIK